MTPDGSVPPCLCPTCKVTWRESFPAPMLKVWTAWGTSCFRQKLCLFCTRRLGVCHDDAALLMGIPERSLDLPRSSPAKAPSPARGSWARDGAQGIVLIAQGQGLLRDLPAAGRLGAESLVSGSRPRAWEPSVRISRRLGPLADFGSRRLLCAPSCSFFFFGDWAPGCSCRRSGTNRTSGPEKREEGGGTRNPNHLHKKALGAAPSEDLKAMG